MSETLFTIGYETATLDQVIGVLKSAGVTRVVDVRAVAASRRPGFSKTILDNSLNADGIEYIHLRALGTPKDGRDAARAGRISEMKEIFNRHLATPEAQDALAQASLITMEKPSALLCYEACAADCHRLIVASLIRTATGCAVRHLEVSA